MRLEQVNADESSWQLEEGPHCGMRPRAHVQALGLCPGRSGRGACAHWPGGLLLHVELAKNDTSEEGEHWTRCELLVQAAEKEMRNCTDTDRLWQDHPPTQALSCKAIPAAILSDAV